MDPKPVQVRIKGLEETGLATEENVVEVGAIAINVQLHDVIEIDGEPREVTGRKIDMKRDHSRPLPPSGGGTPATFKATIKHRSLSKE